MRETEHDDMRAVPQVSTAAKLLGILPLYVDMAVILTQSYLPPKVVRGAAAVVVGIELHPREPALEGRSTLQYHGCVLLEMMPQCIYARIRNCEDIF